MFVPSLQIWKLWSLLCWPPYHHIMHGYESHLTGEVFIWNLLLALLEMTPNSQWHFSYLHILISCFLPRWCCTFQIFNLCLHQDCQLTAKQRYCFQLHVFYSWCPLSHFSLPLNCYFSFIRASWFSPLSSKPFHTCKTFGTRTLYFMSLSCDD